MKRRVFALAAVLMVAGLVAFVRAEEKQVTLKGDLQCAKCVQKDAEAQACQALLVVKDGDQEIKYILENNDISKPFIEKACEKKVPLAVTGTVAEKEGKKVLTATKIEG